MVRVSKRYKKNLVKESQIIEKRFISLVFSLFSLYTLFSTYFENLFFLIFMFNILFFIKSGIFVILAIERRMLCESDCNKLSRNTQWKDENCEFWFEIDFWRHWKNEQRWHQKSDGFSGLYFDVIFRRWKYSKVNKVGCLFPDGYCLYTAPCRIRTKWPSGRSTTLFFVNFSTNWHFSV